MEKIEIHLKDLEMIPEQKSTRPQDIWLEQELSYYNSNGYTNYYKCPCGKGRVVDEKNPTPGFRSHDIYIECEICREKYTI